MIDLEGSSMGILTLKRVPFPIVDETAISPPQFWINL
jgi:hypothetical protein